MTTQHLILEAERLERQLIGANLDMRLELQPAFSSVIQRLRAEGAPIPTRLRRLDASLCDDAIEARFDNMPV